MGPLDPLRNLWEVLQQAPQLARQSLPNRDFVKGVGLGLSADVLGAPVDLMAMGMRPFGYDHPAPWGGSEWVAGKLGASPSNTPQETLGRVAGGLFTPDPSDLLKAGIVIGGPWNPHLADWIPPQPNVLQPGQTLVEVPPPKQRDVAPLTAEQFNQGIAKWLQPPREYGNTAHDMVDWLAEHSVQARVMQNGNIRALERYTQDGKPVERWVQLEPKWRAVKDWMGY